MTVFVFCMETVWRFYARPWIFPLRYAARRGNVFPYIFFFLILVGASACHSETPLPTGQSELRDTSGSLLWDRIGRWRKSLRTRPNGWLYLEKQGYLMAQHTSKLRGNMVRVPIYMWNVLGSGLPSATALDPQAALSD